MNDNTIIPSRRDYRDLTIEDLIAGEAELLARIADLEADVDIYREIATQAIHALHAAHVREVRHREAYRRLLDELPARRERASQDRQAAA